MHRGYRFLLTFILLVGLLFNAFCAECAEIEVDNYYYSQLSSSEQVAYQAMFDCITTLVSKWNCGSFSQETLKKAYDCLLLDHPELFWTNSFTYVTSYVNNAISGHFVEFEYTMTRSEIEQANKEIEQALFGIVKAVGSIEPSYETIRKVYVWMVENCQYDKTNMDQSMYSVMVKRNGVCASFSKAFEFILQCLGVPCVSVNGKLKQGSGLLGSSNLGHEWNLVQINGSWTYIDVTSAVSLYESTGAMNYDYFCCTTAFLEKTHIIDNVLDIPQCNDESLNIFKFYNLELDEYNPNEYNPNEYNPNEYNLDYSQDKILQSFAKTEELGMYPTVRFSNYKAFYEAKTDLITNAKLFQIMATYTGQDIKDLKSLEYTLDENSFSICVTVRNCIKII